MTLKDYLEKNKIKLTSSQRFNLGIRIKNRYWEIYHQNMQKVIEDGFTVNNYEEQFLKSCNRIIIRYVTRDVVPNSKIIQLKSTTN